MRDISGKVRASSGEKTPVKPARRNLMVLLAAAMAGIKVPIIAVTAFAMVGDRKKCLDAGCNDYISKPLDHKELLEMMKKYLQVKTQA